ncbi:MAG: hypothetical protein ABI761_17905 [Saprospiraceae bacterium]
MKSASKVFFLFALMISISHIGIAQNPDASKYIEAIYIKSKNSDYLSIEKNYWKKYHTSIIQAGKQSGWYVYKVKYPTGDQASYDYVVINAYKSWNDLVPSPDISSAAVKIALPANEADAIKAKFELSRSIIWKQVFSLSGQAVEKEVKPSKFIIANEMKVLPGMESEYVKLELTYFKPFHTARAAEGIMNNWGLYKRALPYGDQYPYDYITFNGYATWDDITKQNPPTAWKKVHGDLNFNDIHNLTLSKRQTINVECWELVEYAVATE